MPASDLLSSLTPAQRAAATHVEGPLLVVAGPGSGKTRVVTHRIAYLLERGVDDSAVLALTFTNKAAEEMRERLARLAPGRHVWIGTYHRFCAQLLRQHADLVGLDQNFTIFDADDALRAMKRVLEERHPDLKYATPDQISRAISTAKNNLITAEEYRPQQHPTLGNIVAKVYPDYQRQLLSSNSVDFDDLLMRVAVLLKEQHELRRILDHRYQYILVDEYQDTNLAQYAIVRALAIDHPNLAVTGDPDQSIYAWRGANLRNILEFEKDYPTTRVVKLEQNFRSTKSILRLADTLIANNVRRKAKTLYTENDEGHQVRLLTCGTHRDEADAIAREIARAVERGDRQPSDFAVFYRVNALSRTLEGALRNRGVPFQIVSGVEFFQRTEVKDVLAYLQLLNNPRNDVAFLRIVNRPARNIGKTTLKRLREHAGRYRMNLLAAAREAGLIESLTAKPRNALLSFVKIIDDLALLIASPEEQTVEQIMRQTLIRSGYQESFHPEESSEDSDRFDNVRELLTVAREFDAEWGGRATLEEFLEQTCLVNDTDGFDEDTNKVTLMTLHAAKGLEFPVVYLTAMEKGILPHERSKDVIDRYEEERRLLFVGMTRAKQELTLSWSQMRDFRGSRRRSVPSDFLFELPREEMDCLEIAVSSSEYSSGDGSYASAGRYNSGTAVWQDEEFLQDAPGSKVAENHGDDLAAEPAAGLAAAVQVASKIGAGVTSIRRTTVHDRDAPCIFAVGMAVVHPDYGPGKIVSLDGHGNRTRAVVNFPMHGQVNFIVSKSPLKPA